MYSATEFQNFGDVIGMHQCQNRVMVLQPGFKYTAHDKALQNRFQRAIAHGPRHQQDNTVTHTCAYPSGKHLTQNDAALSGLQHIESAFGEVHHLAGQLALVLGRHTVHQNSHEIAT